MQRFDPCGTPHEQSAIKYQLEELLACRSLLDQAAEEDPETLVNYAAIDFKEVRYGSWKARALLR